MTKYCIACDRKLEFINYFLNKVKESIFVLGTEPKCLVEAVYQKITIFDLGLKRWQADLELLNHVTSMQ